MGGGKSDVRELVKRLKLTNGERRRGIFFSWISNNRWISLAITLGVLLTVSTYIFHINEPLAPVHAPLAPPNLPVTAEEIHEYVGNWVNTNSTGSPSHIEIRQVVGRDTVQIWGKCTPTDCDWGAVDVVPLRSSVTPGARLTSLHATYNQGFAERRVTLRLIDKDQLNATITTHFMDQSGRPDYESTGTFHRS